VRALKGVLKACLDLAEKHRNTVMAGRTHSQQAVPITFGFKAAIWATEFARSIQRMIEIEPRLYVGNMTGAAGTFAAMAPKAEQGPKIESLMMHELGLDTFPVCWHASRDVRAEYASILAIIATTIGKIANEVFTLGRTEIKELEEPIPEGTVGSSTMPGKRNPGTCEELITLSFQARRVAGLSFDGMLINNERDMGWPIGDSGTQITLLITSTMLDWGKWLIQGMAINPENMRRNINEMVMTEALMIRLAEKAGRQTAHELVTEAVKQCATDGKSLKAAVLETKEIMHHMTVAEIEHALDPVNHIGAVPTIIDNVISKLRPLTT
jgi:adenylosuccinate lyase